MMTRRVNEIVIFQANLGLCVPRGGSWPGVRPPAASEGSFLDRGCTIKATYQPANGRGWRTEGGRQRTENRGQTTEGFTSGAGRSKARHDEANGFIVVEQAVGLSVQTARWTDPSNHLVPQK